MCFVINDNLPTLDRQSRDTHIYIEIVQFEHFGWRPFVCNVSEYLKVASVPLDSPDLVPGMWWVAGDHVHVQSLPGLHVPAAVEGGGVPPEHNAGHTHSQVAQTTRTCK